MANFFLILLCLAGGFVLRRWRLFPENAAATLNVFVIYLALPAVILLQIPTLFAERAFSTALLIPISMAWIVFLLSILFVYFIARAFRFSRATKGALILTAGLGNTSFVGFPLLEALYGPSVLPTALLIDQAGSFLVLATLGLTSATYFAKRTSEPLLPSIAKRILRFPPFLSLIAALVLPWLFPPALAWSKPWLEKLASALIPLTLVSVGCQLHVDRASLKLNAKPLALGLIFKLLLAPLAMTILYWLTADGGLASPVVRITILESAMAPMITGAIVAAEFELDPDLTSLMVGVGLPISLVTIVLWNWFLTSV